MKGGSSSKGGISKIKKKINKGAWSAEEDKKLSDFVNTYGDKRWRSLPLEAGLNRCGKSCRLRWLNYLRPGIKRGNITEDEEDLIIRLHNLLGNRWSLIAGRLPGRTDNEIKNHWNTHLSKKSLTIDELNLKLNKKLESNINSNFHVTTNVDRVGSTQPDDKWMSKPMNEFFEEEIDINGFFNFSVESFLPESKLHVGSSESRITEDSNLQGEENYHKVFDSDMILNGSSLGSLDDQLRYDNYDFEQLLYFDDDNIFPSFSST